MGELNQSDIDVIIFRLLNTPVLSFNKEANAGFLRRQAALNEEQGYGKRPMLGQIKLIIDNPDAKKALKKYFKGFSKVCKDSYKPETLEKTRKLFAELIAEVEAE